MNSQDNQSMADMVGTISKFAVAQQQLARQAEQQFSFEVEVILRYQCCDPWCIECLLMECLIFVSIMRCCVYAKSSAAITSKSIPLQPLHINAYIVKCGMVEEVWMVKTNEH